MRKPTDTNLSNKLNLCLIPQEDVDSVAINLKISGGSLNENNNGTAHLLEHLVASKLKHYIKDSTAVKMLGITSRETTTFYFKFLKEDLEEIITIIPAIFSHMEFTKKEVALQKEIVKSEIKRNRSTQERISLRNYHKVLYPQTKLATTNTGSTEDLEKVSIENLQNFKETYYTPKNSVVSISGDIDKKEIIKLAKKYLENIPNFENEKPETRPIIKINEKKTEKISFENSKDDFVRMCFYSYKISDNKTYVANLISTIGLNFLNKIIKEKYGLAYTVDCINHASKSYGTFCFVFRCDKEKTQDIINMITEFIKEFSKGISINILNQAKKQYITEQRMAFDKTSYRANYYGELRLHGRPDQDHIYEQNFINNISPQDITNIGKEIFSTPPKILIVG